MEYIKINKKLICLLIWFIEDVDGFIYIFCVKNNSITS